MDQTTSASISAVYHLAQFCDFLSLKNSLKFIKMWLKTILIGKTNFCWPFSFFSFLVLYHSRWTNKGHVRSCNYRGLFSTSFGHNHEMFHVLLRFFRSELEHWSVHFLGFFWYWIGPLGGSKKDYSERLTSPVLFYVARCMRGGKWLFAELRAEIEIEWFCQYVYRTRAEKSSICFIEHDIFKTEHMYFIAHYKLFLAL